MAGRRRDKLERLREDLALLVSPAIQVLARGRLHVFPYGLIHPGSPPRAQA